MNSYIILPPPPRPPTLADRLILIGIYAASAAVSLTCILAIYRALS
jgi:hypothetical protein